MVTTIKRYLFLALSALFLSSAAFANNVTVSNVTLTGQDATNDYVFVKFDTSWENSWRTSSAPTNWDAVWVFVKYKVGSGDWQHTPFPARQVIILPHRGQQSRRHQTGRGHSYTAALMGRARSA